MIFKTHCLILKSKSQINNILSRLFQRGENPPLRFNLYMYLFYVYKYTPKVLGEHISLEKVLDVKKGD